jgi:hypothetical protein
VKIWFQNKRSKQKKVVKNVSHHSSSSSQPSNPNLSPHHHPSQSINEKSTDSMFLVKREQEQPTSSTAYGRTMDYPNHFWSLPPPSYSTS